MSSSLVSTVINPLKGLLNNNPGVLKNAIASLFVIALNALLSNKDLGFFKCPSKGNFSYGCMFIFVPALVLFLGMFLLTHRLKANSKCCCYPKDSSDKCCKIPTNYGFNMEMFKLLMYSLVAGCLWIFWALLEKKYYTCAVFGSEDQLKNVTGNNRTILEELLQKAQTESETYGFVLIVVVAGIPMLILSVLRCLNPKNRLRKKIADEVKDTTLANLSKIKDFSEAMKLFKDDPMFKNFTVKIKEKVDEFEEKVAGSMLVAMDSTDWKSEDIQKFLKSNKKEKHGETSF